MLPAVQQTFDDNKNYGFYTYYYANKILVSFCLVVFDVCMCSSG